MVGLPLSFLNHRVSIPHSCDDTTIYTIKSTANWFTYCMKDCLERSPFVTRGFPALHFVKTCFTYDQTSMKRFILYPSKAYLQHSSRWDSWQFSRTHTLWMSGFYSHCRISKPVQLLIHWLFVMHYKGMSNMKVKVEIAISLSLALL